LSVKLLKIKALYFFLIFQLLTLSGFVLASSFSAKLSISLTSNLFVILAAEEALTAQQLENRVNSLAEMETGFFESLDLGPNTFANQEEEKLRNNLKKLMSEEKGAPAQNTNFLLVPNNVNQDNSDQDKISEGKVQLKKLEQEKVFAENSTKSKVDMRVLSDKQKGLSAKEISKISLSSSTLIQEDLNMWQYLLLTVIAVAFVLIILVLVRIYRNTKVVQSPDNIVKQIKSLSVDIDTQNKSIKEIKFRIQKTENSFIKILGHHLDEKHDELVKDVDMQFQEFASNQKTSLKQYAELNHKVGAIEDLLDTLKDFVADQKQEIRRLHEGYDWSVINNISVGLINVIDSIDEELDALKGKSEDKKERKRLEEIRDSILILLESHDIKESAPTVGSVYEQQAEDDCTVTFIESKEPKMRGKIARVVKPSFIYRVSKDKKRTIREAEIEVYN